ncbi:MAG: hypothetical protein IT203_11830 [Fimbriimonadaceae bacterium]|nr:hypothetical protein [Fimbriimonadaceae bacterium]
MSAVARFLARRLWGNMLWVMRRPWMKRLQVASLRLFKEEKRGRARLSINRQNRWARKVGLPLLTFAITVLLGSMILTGAYFMVLNLIESGVLDPSTGMKH